MIMKNIPEGPNDNYSSFGPLTCGLFDAGAVDVVGGCRVRGGSGVVDCWWSWEPFGKVVPLCFFGSTHDLKVRVQPQAI
jgi:hypothetical protein